MKTPFVVPNSEISTRFLLIALGSIAFGFLPATAHAAAPYQTSGQTDPTTTGASAVFSTGAPVVTTSSGNDGEGYWRLHSGPFPGDSGGAHYTYSMVAADTSDASGWTFTYRAKIINADRNFEAYFAVVDHNGNAWIGTLLGGPNVGAPAIRYYQAGDEGAFPAVAHDWPGSAGIDTTAYHTYQIVYDPGSSLGKFYIDGVFSFSQASGNQVFPGGVVPTRIEWGDGQGTGAATGTEEQWSNVKFELGQHPAVAQSFIVSRSPAPNAVAVPANTTIDITLQDGAAPVQTNMIQLFFNGSAVSPAIGKPSSITTISYDPPGDLPAGSTNTIKLIFNDTASTKVTNTWSFQVFLADQVVIQHLGTNNPTTEGFSYFQGGTPLPVLSGGNDGEAYWRIHQEPFDNDSGGSYYRYVLPLGYVTNSSGWTATMRVKVNRAIGVGPGKVYCALVDDRDGWLMALNGGPDITPDNTGLYYMEPAQDLVQLSPIDPTPCYRTYQIIYDPSGDSSNGSVTYYADGAVLGTLTRFQTVNVDATGPRIEWGDGEGDGGVTDAQYNLIRFQLGQHIQVTQPGLTLSRSGSQVTLSWTSCGFTVQTNSSLVNPGGWADLPGATNSPTVVNIGSGTLFFRLKK